MLSPALSTRLQITYTRDEKLCAYLFLSCHIKGIAPEKYRELAEWLGIYHYTNPVHRGITCPIFPLSTKDSSDYYRLWKYSMFLEMIPSRIQNFMSEYLNGFSS